MTDEELGPRQRAAETKKRRTRERLVKATLDRYSPDGPIGFPTLEEIAEEADVSLPTLYNHFENRYELHRAAMELLFSPIVQPILTAGEAGVYEPPDLRAEIISYVCRVAILARQYRYLIAVYIQSYFESRAYDSFAESALASPVSSGLEAMIRFGPRSRNMLDLRFSPYGVADVMNNLLLHACHRWSPGPAGDTRALARVISVDVLQVADKEYTRDANEDIFKQIDRLIPEGERSH